MDFKKLLSTFDAVENDTSKNAINKKNEAGSMLAILESFNRAEDEDKDGRIDTSHWHSDDEYDPAYDDDEDDIEEAVSEGSLKNMSISVREDLYDLAQEIQKGMHSYDSVVDELNDMFDAVKTAGDPVAINAFKTLRSLEPEDFGEGEGGGPNRASSAAQDAMDMIDGEDDSDYPHLGGRKVESVEEAIMVSAEGAEAAELLSILQLAGMPAPAPAPMEPEMGPEMDMQDEYSNSPEEFEQDVDAVIASGNDMHREKDQYAAAQDGDNPMKAFEGKFKSIMNELLAEDEK